MFQSSDCPSHQCGDEKSPNAGRMAHGDGVRSSRLHGLVARPEILTEFVRDEQLPIDVVRVRQNRTHTARLYLVPRCEMPVPDPIQSVERSVAFPDPDAESRDGVRTEAELGVGN